MLNDGNVGEETDFVFVTEGILVAVLLEGVGPLHLFGDDCFLIGVSS